MRRFPPPAGSGSFSTPLRSQRSTEAPMQFEWATPRTFPASPFHAATAAPDTPDDESGERARKRTHYEAMDVDTPPRPLPALSDLPPSATASTIPFDLGKTAPPPAADAHPLDFDASAFEPTQAFGVEEDEHSGDGDDANKSLTYVGGFKGEHAAGTEPRRRRAAPAAAAPGGRRKAASHSGEDDDEDAPRRGGFMSMLSGGQGVSGSEFNFQVHHHHGASSSQSGPDGDFTATPGGWFHSQTPYTLLGYLQFASLTLLALVVLSITLLFFYTLYSDVQDRLASLTLEIRAEIFACAKAYVDNSCAPATRLPFVAHACAGWEECMGRDPNVIGKTRVVAETLAEVVNGFVDVISFKTMLFVMASLGLTIYGSSVALSALPTRPSAAPPTPAYAQPPQFQHLGYHPPQFGYHPLSPPVGYGAPWPAMSDGQDGGVGLGAPPPAQASQAKVKKGWLK